MPISVFREKTTSGVSVEIDAYVATPDEKFPDNRMSSVSRPVSYTHLCRALFFYIRLVHIRCDNDKKANDKSGIDQCVD